ncbi:MAG TPA: trigger factor [Acidobacteriaceae bacterium]|nr:trigger factor [Acidobacteriaceae bacterium]
MTTAETTEKTPAAAADPAITPTGPEVHDHEVHDHEGHDHEGHDHHDHEGHEHAQPTLNPECTREVDVEAPADEVSKAFRTVLRKYQKAARIPGFRPGKVPESVLRSRFAGSIREEVVESVLPQHFRQAIAEKNFRPVSQPQVTNLQLEEGQPLRFKAIFEVLPEISVDGYQDVKVDNPSTELTEAEFDAELDRIRDSHSTMEQVNEERGLADGDWAQITFKGQLQGEATEGAEPPANPIEGSDVSVEIGGKDTVEAFSDALRSAKPGQELKFEVTYPTEFAQKRLAGKTVAYDVEVRGIRKKVQPVLDDQFAKEVGDYESLDDLKNKLREHLASDKKNRVTAETRNQLLDALVARYPFPVPESLVQSQIDARLERGLRALAAQGMRTEDMRKLDFEHLREAQRESAANEVKGTILLDRIADVENIQVGDDEVERELQVISLQTREPLETLRDRLTREGNVARIREQLRREKTGNLLVERLA